MKLLPSTEAALLDWAINLMADVVEQEQFNKMNARNIAMVFAPNMTQVRLDYIISRHLWFCSVCCFLVFVKHSLMRFIL